MSNEKNNEKNVEGSIEDFGWVVGGAEADQKKPPSHVYHIEIHVYPPNETYSKKKSSKF